jgi:small subunit ribosomal protein S18
MLVRRKRTLDPNTPIDYKKPEILKRFITERGKIIPRRISGANALQQRQICVAVKRARFLALIPSAVSHRPERGFAGEVAAALAGMGSGFGFRGDRRDDRRDRRDDRREDMNREQVEGADLGQGGDEDEE